jgi:hypothetical protein
LGIRFSPPNASLLALATRWGDRIDYVAGDETERLGARALLVRPDGVTVWATDEMVDIGEIVSITTQWFGKPTQLAGR